MINGITRTKVILFYVGVPCFRFTLAFAFMFVLLAFAFSPPHFFVVIEVAVGQQSFVRVVLECFCYK